MTKEKLRDNAGFILVGKKVNIEKFKTRYLTFSGLVILAGIQLAPPSGCRSHGRRRVTTTTETRSIVHPLNTPARTDRTRRDAE